MESIVSMLLFLQDYVVTFIFAIGVIAFIYGYVNSYMLGRSDIGYPSLMRSLFFFTIALLLYGVLAFLLWALSFYGAVRAEEERQQQLPSAEVERNRSLLPTPNAPQGND